MSNTNNLLLSSTGVKGQLHTGLKLLPLELRNTVSHILHDSNLHSAQTAFSVVTHLTLDVQNNQSHITTVLCSSRVPETDPWGQPSSIKATKQKQEKINKEQIPLTPHDMMYFWKIWCKCSCILRDVWHKDKRNPLCPCTRCSLIYYYLFHLHTETEKNADGRQLRSTNIQGPNHPNKAKQHIINVTMEVISAFITELAQNCCVWMF